MARSAKLSPTTQDERELNGQLSLFHTNTKKFDDEKENTTKKEAAPASNDKPMGKTKKASNTNYSAADIQVLEGIAAIRHRPGMYIGCTSATGLLHLIWEALDNAVDEAVAGFGTHIWVSLESEGWVTVRDEARGMPFDPMLYQGELFACCDGYFNGAAFRREI